MCGCEIQVRGILWQDLDSEDLVSEAIATCPVDCIYWVDYEDLVTLEKEREDQTLDVKVLLIPRPSERL
jgi:hypothetical protein